MRLVQGEIGWGFEMKNPLDSVIEYLEGYGEHPTGLTVRKIQDRSKFLESSEDGDTIYFEF